MKSAFHESSSMSANWKSSGSKSCIGSADRSESVSRLSGSVKSDGERRGFAVGKGGKPCPVWAIARATKLWVGDWLMESPMDDWGEIDPRDPPAEEIQDNLADLFEGVPELGVFNADCAGR